MQPQLKNEGQSKKRDLNQVHLHGSAQDRISKSKSLTKTPHPSPEFKSQDKIQIKASQSISEIQVQSQVGLAQKAKSQLRNLSLNQQIVLKEQDVSQHSFSFEKNTQIQAQSVSANKAGPSVTQKVVLKSKIVPDPLESTFNENRAFPDIHPEGNPVEISQPIQQTSQQKIVRQVKTKKVDTISESSALEIERQRDHNKQVGLKGQQKLVAPQIASITSKFQAPCNVQTLEAQIVQRHLDMIEKFEQHFPHYQFIKGRSVLYSDSCAEIESVDPSYSARNQGRGPSDYEKLQAQVKIYADSPSIPMHIKYLKYLGRAYTCDTRFIDFEGLSEELQESLNSESLHRGKILLVQVIDNSNKYNPAQLQYSSDYPMQFYALGKDEFEERIILKGPAQFKANAEGELFDPLRDLVVFDEQTASSQQLCYKQEIAEFIKKEACQISKRYSKYLADVRKVPVTGANVFDSLFTLCLYVNNEGQRRKGVLLQVKQDARRQDLPDRIQRAGSPQSLRLLFRQIQIKQTQTDKFEWVNLRLPGLLSEKPQDPVSEYCRGLVSLDYLKNLDNSYATGVRLRSKHLYFISHEASLLQVNRQLNTSAVPALVIPEPGADKMELGGILNDEDSKLSVPQPKIQCELPSDRDCTACEGGDSAGALGLLSCSECHRCWHVSCLEGEAASKIGISEKLWRCRTCLRCSNCRSMVGNQRSLLICKCCNSPYHYECLEPQFKSALPQSIVQMEMKNRSASGSRPPDEAPHDLTKVDFKCQNCLRCENCFTRNAGGSLDHGDDLLEAQKCVRWSEGLRFCAECNDGVDSQVAAGRSLQCQSCQSPITEDQDLLLVNARTRENLFGTHSAFRYNCPTCRMAKRVRLIHRVIDFLSEKLASIFHYPQNLLASLKGGDPTKYLTAVERLQPDVIKVLQKHLQRPEQLVVTEGRKLKETNNAHQQPGLALPKSSETHGSDGLSPLVDQCLKWLQNYQEHLRKQGQAHAKESAFLKSLDNCWQGLPKAALRTSSQAVGTAVRKKFSQSTDGEEAFIPEEHHRSMQDVFSVIGVVEDPRNVQGLKTLESKQDLEECMPSQDQRLPGLQAQSSSHTAPPKHTSSRLKQRRDKGEPKTGEGGLPAQEQRVFDGQPAAGFEHRPRQDDDVAEALGVDHQSQPRSSTRRKLQKVDYKGNAAVHVGSATYFSMLDKSAPCEFGATMMPANGEGMEQQDNGRAGDSPEPSRAVEDTMSLWGAGPHVKRPFKKQKVSDNYESIGESIAVVIEQNVFESSVQGAEPSSEKQGHFGGNFQSRGAVGEKYSVSGNTSQQIFNPNSFKDRSRKKMMEHYQREDDEGCYYSNPIRCSFDDPRLIFEEMCYLCGSFGNQEDFVTCTLCAESFHTYCLQLSSNEIQEMFQTNWKCLNCKSCEVCGKATDEDKLNFCDKCDRPYHSFCLQPVINHFPEQWKCEHCFHCTSCGTNQYYSETDVINGVNLTNSDYQLSKNYSLCYECGQNEHKKQSCSICHKKTSQLMHLNQQTLKCQECGFYSHTQCSRVDVPKLQEILAEANSRSGPEQQLGSIERVFRCFDCIVSGKSVNFLILESCLHYEYIHNLIQRQKLLGEICIEILGNYFPEKFREKAPIFIEKFISRNQEFFKYDESIVKWVELMETEVNFDPQDYDVLPASLNTVSPARIEKEETVSENIDEVHQEPATVLTGDEVIGQQSQAAAGTAVKQEVLICEPTEQPQLRSAISNDEEMEGQSLKPQRIIDLQQTKGHWRKYNPFEPSELLNCRLLSTNENSSEPEATFNKFQKRRYGLRPNQEVTHVMRVEREMTHFKKSLLPAKRSLYGSLYKANLNRYAQSTHSVSGNSIYVKPEDIQKELYSTDTQQKKLVDRLVNGLEEFDELSWEGTSVDSGEDEDSVLSEGAVPITLKPTETRILPKQSSNRSILELYVQCELKAVMRIKLQFFKWFEDFFTQTTSVFLGQSQEKGGKATLAAPEKKATEGDIHLQRDARSGNSTSKHEEESSESVVGCYEDTPVLNPQQTLACLLCRQKGQFSVTGRLIPYKLNIYVHTSCALWTNEVFDIDDGQILNFYQQQKKLSHQKCSLCGEQGATISCARTKGCNKHFHFPCAYRSGKIKFTKAKEVFCEACNRLRSGSNALASAAQGHFTSVSHGTKHDGLLHDTWDDQNTQIFPADYLQKKRLYIVSNFDEIAQQDYENELEAQMLPDQHQSSAPPRQATSAKTGASKDRPEKELKSLKAEKDKSSPKKKDKEATSSSPAQPLLHREVEVDKWRPFYYDLFNRVGNLTVLSLRKEVNQLIDIIQKDSTASGVNSIQAYVQQQQQILNEQLGTLGPQARGANGRFQSQSGFAGTTGTSLALTGNLMEDLRRQLDLFSDYATIRIYWKFYDDKRMSKPARGSHDPRNLQRAYYLFINRTKQIIELDKNDIKTVMDYCSQQIKKNQGIQSNFSAYLRSAEGPACRIQQSDLMSLEHFWARLMDHFRAQRSNFSLQNIEFCVEKLFGLAKYPINVWNQLELTTNDLRYNLNQHKSKLSFFLKSALAIMSSSGYAYPSAGASGLPSASGGLSGGNGSGSTGQGGVRGEKYNDQTTSINNVLMGKVLTLEGVFQRMVKVNNMERYDHEGMMLASAYGHPSGNPAPSNSMGITSFNLFSHSRTDQRINQLDQLSINPISSKHMRYSQIMIALGKGKKVDIASYLEARKNNKKLGDQQPQGVRPRKKTLSEFKSQFQQAQQQRDASVQQQQADLNNHNQAASKGSKVNLPIAMQYRRALLAPKQLEVGPSKIHRIGLFTQEKLKQDDILIEYVGEIIRHQVADQREKRYKEKGIGDCYMFRIDDQYVIDATFFGGKARYLNHSCDANCTAQIITVDGQQHIIIRAKKHIMEQEELTYNYNFNEEEDKLSCFCGAKNCEGDF